MLEPQNNVFSDPQSGSYGYLNNASDVKLMKNLFSASDYELEQTILVLDKFFKHAQLTVNDFLSSGNDINLLKSLFSTNEEELTRAVLSFEQFFFSKPANKGLHTGLFSSDRRYETRAKYYTFLRKVLFALIAQVIAQKTLDELSADLKLQEQINDLVNKLPALPRHIVDSHVFYWGSFRDILLAGILLSLPLFNTWLLEPFYHQYFFIDELRVVDYLVVSPLVALIALPITFGVVLPLNMIEAVIRVVEILVKLVGKAFDSCTATKQDDPKSEWDPLLKSGSPQNSVVNKNNKFSFFKSSTNEAELIPFFAKYFSSASQGDEEISQAQGQVFHA